MVSDCGFLVIVVLHNIHTHTTWSLLSFLSQEFVCFLLAQHTSDIEVRLYLAIDVSPRDYPNNAAALPISGSTPCKLSRLLTLSTPEDMS